MSHAALYPHFADRGALLDAAFPERWVNARRSRWRRSAARTKTRSRKYMNGFKKLYGAKREKVLNRSGVVQIVQPRRRAAQTVL